MKFQSSIWLMGILVFLVPFAAFALYNYYEKTFEQLPVFGETKIINGKNQFHTIPDFNLLNQDSQATSSTRWTNKIVVADFFFTYCPTICPKMTRSLKTVQDAFEEERDGILFNSFSIDPGRDHPGRLKIYAQKFSIATDNWQFLTGDKKDIYKLARNGFRIVATDGDGGPNDFIHSEKLVLIDRQRRIRGYYDGTNLEDVNNLIHDIKKLQHEN